MHGVLSAIDGLTSVAAGGHVRWLETVADRLGGRDGLVRALRDVATANPGVLPELDVLRQELGLPRAALSGTLAFGQWPDVVATMVGRRNQGRPEKQVSIGMLRAYLDAVVPADEPAKSAAVDRLVVQARVDAPPTGHEHATDFIVDTLMARGAPTGDAATDRNVAQAVSALDEWMRVGHEEVDVLPHKLERVIASALKSTHLGIEKLEFAYRQLTGGAGRGDIGLDLRAAVGAERIKLFAVTGVRASLGYGTDTLAGTVRHQRREVADDLNQYLGGKEIKSSELAARVAAVLKDAPGVPDDVAEFQRVFEELAGRKLVAALKEGGRRHESRLNDILRRLQRAVPTAMSPRDELVHMLVTWPATSESDRDRQVAPMPFRTIRRIRDAVDGGLEPVGELVSHLVKAAIGGRDGDLDEQATQEVLVWIAANAVVRDPDRLEAIHQLFLVLEQGRSLTGALGPRMVWFATKLESWLTSKSSMQPIVRYAKSILPGDDGPMRRTAQEWFQLVFFEVHGKSLSEVLDRRPLLLDSGDMYRYRERLIETLAIHPGQGLTRPELLRGIWAVRRVLSGQPRAGADEVFDIARQLAFAELGLSGSPHLLTEKAQLVQHAFAAGVVIDVPVTRQDLLHDLIATLSGELTARSTGTGMPITVLIDDAGGTQKAWRAELADSITSALAATGGTFSIGVGDTDIALDSPQSLPTARILVDYLGEMPVQRVHRPDDPVVEEAESEPQIVGMPLEHLLALNFLAVRTDFMTGDVADADRTVSVEVVNSLQASGFVKQDGDRLWITPRGTRALASAEDAAAMDRLGGVLWRLDDQQRRSIEQWVQAVTAGDVASARLPRPIENDAVAQLELFGDNAEGVSLSGPPEYLELFQGWFSVDFQRREDGSLAVPDGAITVADLAAWLARRAAGDLRPVLVMAPGSFSVAAELAARLGVPAVGELGGDWFRTIPVNDGEAVGLEEPEFLGADLDEAMAALGVERVHGHP